MRFPRFSRPIIGLAVFLAALALAGAAWAASGFALDRGRPVSGGVSSGGGFTLIGAVGQPEAGQLSGGGFTLSGGILAEQPTPTPTASHTPSPTNTPPPGATLTFTPLPTNTPLPSATAAPTNTALPTTTPPPGASLTPTPTATPIRADLSVSVGALVGSGAASAGAITTRDGLTLELPAGLEQPAAAVNLQVTITNTGLVDTPNDFWVDLYVNPGRTPQVNLTWDAACTDICVGVSWHVTNHLHPGESLTLSTASGYDLDNSIWPGFVPVMTRAVAVYVDSFTEQGYWYGMVMEADEGNNLARMSMGATPTPGGPSTVFLPLVQRGGTP